MPERKTVGQLMEEMRLKAGAQNYHGHEYMDLERFAEDTRHMIIFDVLTDDSPVGWKLPSIWSQASSTKRSGKQSRTMWAWKAPTSPRKRWRPALIWCGRAIAATS